MATVKSLLLLTTFTALTAANPLLLGRAIGSSCNAPEGSGTCQPTSGCKGISYPQILCPYDANDIQCCVEQACTVDAGSGFCRSVSNNGCDGGSFHQGKGPIWPCPGSDNIQCCIKGGSTPPTNPPAGGPPCTVSAGSGTCMSKSAGGCSGTFHQGFGPPWPCPGNDDIECCVTSPAPPAPGNGGIGQRILDKAKEAAGLPYAWGGGSCNGPSGDMAPYDYGEVGFDCSGLVCWAVCQITGRNLFAEGLRVTHSMYCASKGQLRYPKVPYDQRKAGDAVFYGDACDCNNRQTIHHVALVMEDINRVWNAPNDDINKVQEQGINSFGENPCPYVIRFS